MDMNPEGINSMMNLNYLKRFLSFRYLLLATAIIAFLMMMVGYVVRFDGVEGACPDWPTCYGQAAFPADLAGRWEMIHRGLAGLAGLLVLGAAAWAWRTKESGLMRGLLSVAAIVMGIEGVAGGVMVLYGSNPWLSVLHLGLAMVSMSLIVAATSAAFLVGRDAAKRLRLNFRSPYSRLVFAGLGSVFVLMVSGSLLANLNLGQTCAGWFLCASGMPDSPAGWFSLAHRFLSATAGVLVLLIFFRAWKGLKQQPFLLTAATGAGLLFAGQVLIGAIKVSRGYPPDLVGLHAATAAGLWAVLAALAFGVGLTETLVESRVENKIVSKRQRITAFVMLNKPIIVALLLVTTYAGMVVGGKQIPGLWLTFWTLVGGGLAAGGASALNQYIDRIIDGNMQRTAKRPLPAGLLTPSEALAYGLGACLAAFFILAGFVNLLAAVLSLAGMIYYVLLYSILLKYATVQNIVIGGGAGAIPPLVGWAAATGSLNIPSLFLFALVFMWTPPHFWALALVRAKDYARAGVPMLPVIKGEKETRRQIFIYTLELVGLTLLMPVFNIAGSIFLISAVVLGLWLISTAWRVVRNPGNKQAWRMYRYSSMYLAFIFLALVVDVLV
jgi:heme o synthase